MDLNIQKLPVFVFPPALKFYLNSRQTHKQLLTLYNPYEFPVRFKVLCTSPNKYTVIDPEGSIGPSKCVDIVIRHTMPLLAHCNITDKFRITLQDHTTKQVLGKRDIESKLLQAESDTSSNDGDNFHSLPHAEKDLDEPRNVQYPIKNIQRYFLIKIKLKMFYIL
ncbi:motile sperm domain-containing protein 1-like [Agrilus planipennis]|uniref:Motile sperm domain-containing protein 3 n=1 Tax=Agrilus planipennis TaxID=224129 RepID=A0A7F5R2J7_AGRPL|nr:motile sperm domain-containing protein 1-like isoform X2 [Agrilus planipennis]XP_025835397.1 motile sperm domain-containing protein 1-like [Agrilus planipennis]